ncbi:MAG TPA: hypothetical protein DET40_02285 [Lentisphaeria bacterium]|nr:MAG: hypothetical protein A2X45_16885 [Lentisphaerae bacterium GWF2_50_93]HCE42360.1 hypothetical protein [Lentisphaeria bacterium]
MKNIFALSLFITLFFQTMPSYATGEQYVTAYNKLVEGLNQRIEFCYGIDIAGMALPENHQYAHPDETEVENYNLRVASANSQYGKGLYQKKFVLESVSQEELNSIRTRALDLARTKYLLDASLHIPQEDNGQILYDDIDRYTLPLLTSAQAVDYFTKIEAKHVNNNTIIKSSSFTDAPLMWIHFTEIATFIDQLVWAKFPVSSWEECKTRYTNTRMVVLDGKMYLYRSGKADEFESSSNWVSFPTQLQRCQNEWSNSEWIDGGGAPSWEVFYDIHTMYWDGYPWGTFTTRIGVNRSKAKAIPGKYTSIEIIEVDDQGNQVPTIETSTGTFQAIWRYDRTEINSVRNFNEYKSTKQADNSFLSELINDIACPMEAPPREPAGNNEKTSVSKLISSALMICDGKFKKPELVNPNDDESNDGLVEICGCTSCKLTWDDEFDQMRKCGKIKFPLGLSNGNIGGLRVKAYIAERDYADTRIQMYSLNTCIAGEFSVTEPQPDGRSWSFTLVKRPTGTEVLFALSGTDTGKPVDNSNPYTMRRYSPEVQYEIKFPSGDGNVYHRFSNNRISECLKEDKDEAFLTTESSEFGQWPGLTTNYADTGNPNSRILSVISPPVDTFPDYHTMYNKDYAYQVTVKDKTGTALQILTASHANDAGIRTITLQSLERISQGQMVLESKKTYTFNLDSGAVQINVYDTSGGGNNVAESTSYTDSITKDGHQLSKKTVLINGESRKSYTKYKWFPWGREIIEEIIAPNTAMEKRTTYAYYENPLDNGYKKLQSVYSNDGSWTRYEYDAAGREVRVITPFGSGKLDTEANLSRVTEYTYDGNPSDLSPSCIVQKALGAEISRSYSISQGGQSYSVRAAAPGAAWDAAGNLATATECYPDGAFMGRIRKITNPDGTITVYNYSLDNGILTTTVESGAGTGYSVTDGTRSVTITDAAGRTTSSSTIDIASGITLSSQAYTRDAFGRATRVDYSDGTHTETVYGCCGPELEIDREGIVTVTGHDALKRVTFTTRAGISTLYSYDVFGNVKLTTRKGTDNSECTTSNTYDAAGDLASTTDPLGNTTSYSLAYAARTRTTTNPDGSTSIVRSNADGSTYEVSGTAVHGVKYEYGVDAGQTYSKSYPTDIPTQWTKSFTDFLGRNYKTVYADGAQSVTYYDDCGRPVRQTAAGHTTLTAYNAKGEVSSTAVDMNNNGTIDNGTDKVTVYSNSVTGSVHRQTVTQNNVLVSVSDTSLNGLNSSQTSFGRTSSSTTVLNGNGQKTVTGNNPDGSSVVQSYVNGMLMSSVHSVLGTTNYSYDPHGRLSSQQTTINGQQRTTSFAYDNNDRTLSVTDPAGRATSYTYDSMGRMTKMTQPDGRVVFYSFAKTGELTNVKGANTYPVKYSYDVIGRMKTLTDGNGSVTTWNYSADRGFMTSKVYADSGAVSYAYNSDGSVSSRTWTRGIVTNYAYNAAGELTGVTYGGGAASPVTFTRDLFGRPTTIADGTGSRTLSYNNDFTISSETTPNIANHSVNYGYDNLGRRNSMSLQNGETALSTASYTYDGMSRLASVGNGTNTASYTRISGSSLLYTTSVGDMTTTRAYDNLNRLTSISSVSPASTMSYSYTYNNSDQRSKLTLADGSYWVYKYDLYGQVTAAHKYNAGGVLVPGQQFDYAFDTIGNRKVEKRNGGTFEYNANNVNQYLQRTVPGTISVSGSADVTAEVRIQQESNGSVFKPARTGKYYSKSFTLDNSSSPVEDMFNIFAVRFDQNQGKDIVAKQIEKMFLAKTPELYTYDPDGNLLSDGRFTYTWDGENRLISVTPILQVADSKKLDFSYDYMGRRVSKTVYSWVNNAWQVSKVEKYAWDGWNCIAKFNASNALLESYLWGEDLSGSLQGAGGVGGLLAVSGSSGTYIPAYDGNGNVMAYVDASNGNKVAEFEYDAFGRTIVKAGVKADDMTYRFSTKEYEPNSGLILFETRPLNTDTGRWLSRDSIEEKGGNNLYGFLDNNPLNSVDVLGMKGSSGGSSPSKGTDTVLKNQGCCYIFTIKVDNNLAVTEDGVSFLRNIRNTQVAGFYSGKSTIGHTWVRIERKGDEGSIIEGGHSGETGEDTSVAEPEFRTYLGGVVALARYSRLKTSVSSNTLMGMPEADINNPIRWLSHIYKDGHWASGSGGHTSISKECSWCISEDEYNSVKNEIQRLRSGTELKNYGLTGKQCTSTATAIAAKANIGLNPYVTVTFPSSTPIFSPLNQGGVWLGLFPFWSDSSYKSITFAHPGKMEQELENWNGWKKKSCK